MGFAPVKQLKGPVKVMNPVVKSELVGRTLELTTNAGKETFVLPSPFSRKLLEKTVRAGKPLGHVEPVHDDKPAPKMRVLRFNKPPSISDTGGALSLGRVKPLPDEKPVGAVSTPPMISFASLSGDVQQFFMARNAKKAANEIINTMFIIASRNDGKKNDPLTARLMVVLLDAAYAKDLKVLCAKLAPARAKIQAIAGDYAEGMKRFNQLVQSLPAEPAAEPVREVTSRTHRTPNVRGGERAGRSQRAE